MIRLRRGSAGWEGAGATKSTTIDWWQVQSSSSFKLITQTIGRPCLQNKIGSWRGEVTLNKCIAPGYIRAYQAREAPSQPGYSHYSLWRSVLFLCRAVSLRSSSSTPRVLNATLSQHFRILPRSIVPYVVIAYDAYRPASFRLILRRLRLSPRRILQQRRIDRARWQMHVSHDRSANEHVFCRALAIR